VRERLAPREINALPLWQASSYESKELFAKTGSGQN
jgi:hypothetical protein